MGKYSWDTYENVANKPLKFNAILRERKEILKYVMHIDY